MFSQNTRFEPLTSLAMPTVKVQQDPIQQAGTRNIKKKI